MDDNFNIFSVGKNARNAALAISEISDEVISDTLVLFSKLIQKNKDKILKANQEDVQLAIHNNSSKAFIDRLKLDDDRVNSMETVLLDIAKQNSPVDQILEMFFRLNDTHARRFYHFFGSSLCSSFEEGRL